MCFKYWGLEGAFDKEDDSHKDNIRETMLKGSKHLKCPTLYITGKPETGAFDIVLPKTTSIPLIDYC